MEQEFGSPDTGGNELPKQELAETANERIRATNLQPE